MFDRVVYFFSIIRIMVNEIYLPMPLLFDRKSKPSVQEVVDSLQGFDAISKRFPKVLSKLLDVQIKDVDVVVNKIEIGSLYDDLVVKFAFGGQEQMDLFLQEMHRKFMDHKAVAYLVFFALLVSGGMLAYNVLSPDDAPMAPVINSNNTTIINMISADVGKDADAVRSIIERAVPHSDSIKLAKDSYKIFNAFGDGDSLRFAGFDGYSLPSDVVKAFPSNSDFESVNDIRDFENVEVQIRAADMDSVNSGWAAKVPVISDKRVKVKVSDNVDVTRLHIGKSVFADITVVYKAKNDDLIPSYCVIRKIR